MGLNNNHRDDRSDDEVAEYRKNGIRILSKRHIESYLFDDTVIMKLCQKEQKPELYDHCIEEKKKAIQNSIARGNANDDVKSASGEIYTSLKSILGLTRCGNNAVSFMRDTMAPLITPDMEI